MDNEKLTMADWKLDYPSFIEELFTTATKHKDSGLAIMKIPIQLLNHFIYEITKRATELDDPKLNIIMLKMNLYEVPHNEIDNIIKEQKKRIGE